MKHLLRVSLLAAALSASVLAFSQSAVGTWNGRIDASGMKAKNAQEQKVMGQVKKMLAAMRVKLTLKADRTYTVSFSGAPGNAKPQTESGKWSQSGRTITVRDKKGKPQTMTMSANGRTMTMVPPANQGTPKGMKVVFTKA